VTLNFFYTSFSFLAILAAVMVVVSPPDSQRPLSYHNPSFGIAGHYVLLTTMLPAFSTLVRRTAIMVLLYLM